MFLEDLPQLSPDNQASTECPLTLNELTESIKYMKSEKSPGSDGLSTDFYKFFWSDIKILVYARLNIAYEEQCTSEEQRKAVLRLIPQKIKILLT